MKKELNNLLTVSSTPKHLDINGAFRVTATPVSAHGEPVTVFKGAVPARMSLTLTYTLAHDEAYGRSRRLTSETWDALQAEIGTAMREILDEITHSMLTAWNNGYIQGTIKED